MARLERSTLPDHEGTRTVVLRFLKIITPVKCVIPQYDNHVPFPKEGGLFQQNVSTKCNRVWGVNIDLPGHKKRSVPRGLQLLWDV